MKIREAAPVDLIGDSRVHASCLTYIMAPLVFFASAMLPATFFAIIAEGLLPVALLIGLSSGVATTFVANRWMSHRFKTMFADENAPVVELDDGRITFSWYDMSHSAELSECRFQVGDACRARLYRTQLAFLPGYRVILIYMPPFGAGLNPTYATCVAPVGFAGTMRDRWASIIAQYTSETGTLSDQG